MVAINSEEFAIRKIQTANVDEMEIQLQHVVPILNASVVVIKD